MNYNLITNVEACYAFIQEVPFGLIYYSHIPTAIIALMVGIFVLYKNKKSLLNWLLFLFSLIFFFWSFADLVTWVYGYHSIFTMFAWSLLGMLNILLFIIGLYFVYVFYDKKDLSYVKKIIFVLIVLPAILVTPTTLNLSEFNAPGCSPIEGQYFQYYQYIVNILISIWILFISVFRYVRADRIMKKQIILFSFGIVSFFLSFFITGYLAPYLYEHGYSSDYRIQSIGMFGMPIFIALLAYLIVKYEAFQVKLMGAQVLVLSLIILIASQFAFIQNNTNRILTGITLALSIVFGWWLVRSVKDEIKKKEELMDMTEKLSQAYTKMKQLERAKSEFVSIASHQLRTPLTAVKGFISMLLDGTYGRVTKGVREVLEKVYLSNERLIRLVEDLLNISRIESGRLTFKFQANDIEELVRDIAETMKFAATNKGLYLDYQPPKFKIEPFIFDRDKLREVISNLVDNAIKYTKKGGVTVRIRQVRQGGGEFDYSNSLARKGQRAVQVANSAGKGAIQVVVSDTGVGIEKGEEKYIFEKFQRGSEINKVHTEGVGLGLFVAQKIIESHQAKIWAESDGLGRGSRFFVQLRQDFQPATDEGKMGDAFMPADRPIKAEEVLKEQVK